jgi:hypothetical protein
LINVPTTDGKYFTGIGSNITMTVRDALGNPITGIFVKEQVFAEDGTVIRQRETPYPVRDDGTIPDLIGVGKAPIPSTPLSQSEATDVLDRIVALPRDQRTVQVLTFFAKEGYLIGSAVINRRFTNLDSDGKVRPHKDPTTGARMVNFTTNVDKPIVGRP